MQLQQHASLTGRRACADTGTSSGADLNAAAADAPAYAPSSGSQQTGREATGGTPEGSTTPSSTGGGGGGVATGGLEPGSDAFRQLQMVVDTALLIGLLAVGDRVATLRLLREQHRVSLTEGRRALIDAGLFLELVRLLSVHFGPLFCLFWPTLSSDLFHSGWYRVLPGVPRPVLRRRWRESQAGRSRR